MQKAFSLSSAGQYLVFDSSDLSIETMELFCIYVLHCFWIDVVVQICPKCLCIYGFVNKFWTGRIFERLQKVCGGSNLSTVLLLWGIYIKKCISLVRICLQTRNARNASTKFRKTLESKKWSIRFANMKHKPAACMKWQLRCREAKRAVNFPCAEGTLHRAKPCFIFHAR